jgi:hypothetical protein
MAMKPASSPSTSASVVDEALRQEAAHAVLALLGQECGGVFGRGFVQDEFLGGAASSAAAAGISSGVRERMRMVLQSVREKPR